MKKTCVFALLLGLASVSYSMDPDQIQNSLNQHQLALVPNQEKREVAKMIKSISEQREYLKQKKQELAKQNEKAKLGNLLINVTRQFDPQAVKNAEKMLASIQEQQAYLETARFQETIKNSTRKADQ